MNRHLQKLYHCSPAPVRSLAATLRGLHLRRWRYGPETESLVEQALARETWNAATWNSWQQQRLALTLHRAVTRVPYYRDYWAKRRAAGDRTSWEDLSHWPVLEKETVRQNPVAFLADDCDPRSMFAEHTSGTSGKPLRLWWSRDTVRQWYALFEARWRRWYGVSRFDRWANIGGQLVTPVKRKRPPFWVWNGAMRQLYMSSYHLSPDLIPYYLDALVKYRVKYLFGYTSSLMALAHEARRLGWRETPFQLSLTNAEPLLDHQRDVLQEAFGCPARETYGMAEIVTAASECSAGQLHLWPEVGIVELLEGDQAVSLGTPGDLVCTGLFNQDMPLIRYRLGDRGCRAIREAECGCGRLLPSLSYIEGRCDDLLYTPEGRRVGRLDTVFKNDAPIREAQIIQQKLDELLVRIVKAPGYSSHTERGLVERLQERMGPVHVRMEYVEELRRGAGGKFQAVVCELSDEQRQLAANVAEKEPV